MRIGNGYDVHRLVNGRKLILGGVEIPHDTGLLGNSDADVLLHSIMDAMLGASALGDLGRILDDPSWPYFKEFNSMLHLKGVGDLIKRHGYAVENIDSIIVAQKPKLAEYIPRMQSNIAEALGLDTSQVSVKATTEEKLGFTGTEQGISSYAVCLLSNN